MVTADVLLQDGVTVQADGIEYDLAGNCTHICFYIKSVGTTSGGTILLETSDDPGFTGTWYPLATAINASVTSADKISCTQFVGTYRVIRARIATTITGGGTISIRLVASC